MARWINSDSQRLWFELLRILPSGIWYREGDPHGDLIGVTLGTSGWSELSLLQKWPHWLTNWLNIRELQNDLMIVSFGILFQSEADMEAVIFILIIIFASDSCHLLKNVRILSAQDECTIFPKYSRFKAGPSKQKRTLQS